MSEWKTAIERPTPVAGEHESPTLEESIGFAPRRRPWYPHLIVIDDHCSDTGEIIRVRRDCLTLGRTGCDLSFPAEGLMSAMHAKISLREVSTNHWAWVLEDLASRNGVYVRQTEFRLYPGNEFLMGGTKFIFHGDTKLSPRSTTAIPSLVPFVADTNQIRSQTELEISSYLFSQEAAAIPVRGKKMHIGRQAEGATVLAVDPFVEPVHASIQKVDSGSWKIVDQTSLNGLWLRVRSVILSSPTSFMLGEQRFRFINQDHPK